MTVRLLRAITSAVVGTTTTASDGTYLFTAVPAGDYVIEFAAPAGFSFVPADAGPDGFDSDVDATTGRTTVATLRGDVADLDAGLVLTPVDLALTISQSSARPKQGDTLTYTLDVTNDGPTTVYGPIRLVQQLPSGVTPVAAAGETWDCSITGSEVTCIRALALVPGEAAPPIVVTTTVIDSRGDLVSRASVGTPADELSLANNQVETMATMATQGGSLPFTGADTLRLILVAAGVLALGLFLTYGPRRRAA